MTTIPIYTIGYGNRSIEEFIQLLQAYNIQYLVDIRSQPYSRFSPDFSQKALQQHLKQHNIGYIYMGKELGGRPKDSSAYKEEGKIDYEKLAALPLYQEGIRRTQTAWDQQLRIVLMCSELRPTECHRGKLIGNSLLEKGVQVAHINETGGITMQEEVQDVLDANKQGQLFLFDQLNDRKHSSRKAYDVPDKEA